LSFKWSKKHDTNVQDTKLIFERGVKNANYLKLICITECGNKYIQYTHRKKLNDTDMDLLIINALNAKGRYHANS
jgi:hypothetical protein